MSDYIDAAEHERKIVEFQTGYAIEVCQIINAAADLDQLAAVGAELAAEPSWCRSHDHVRESYRDRRAELRKAGGHE